MREPAPTYQDNINLGILACKSEETRCDLAYHLFAIAYCDKHRELPEKFSAEIEKTQEELELVKKSILDEDEAEHFSEGYAFEKYRLETLLSNLLEQLEMAARLEEFVKTGDEFYL